MNARIITAALLTLLASGCASLTGSDMQSVAVSTTDASGGAVEKAQCTLQGPKGTWLVSTPGSVVIGRSADDMQVDCQKDGSPAGAATMVSRVQAAMFGNIIFGGGVGAIIDHTRGTAYAYPQRVNVIMGRTITIDRRDELEAAARQEEALAAKKP